jgi:hypothetical protein
MLDQASTKSMPSFELAQLISEKEEKGHDRREPAKT